MTGRELIEKIHELKAEDKEVMCIDFDGFISGATEVSIAPDALSDADYIVIT